MIKLTMPLTHKDLEKLRIGDKVLLTGYIYTARDAAHKRIKELIEKKLDTPFAINGSIIYYTGPTPSKPGEVIGSCGPTTSYRMDSFMELMGKEGQLASIGKGDRGSSVIEACKKYKMVYFLITGGIGALLKSKILESEIIAFPDLGAEAIRKVYVKDFPLSVGYDTLGNDLFKETQK